jgi:hypothetical protein
LFRERSDRTLHGGIRDERVHLSPGCRHAVDRGRDIVEPANVSSQAERGSSGVLDFDLRGVELGLMAAE